MNMNSDLLQALGIYGRFVRASLQGCELAKSSTVHDLR